MRSFYSWIARHGGLCRIFLFFALISFTLYASQFEYVSFISIYFIDLLIWFLVGRFLAVAPANLTRAPLEQLNQHCDPYPFLEEMERQLTWNLTGWQHQIIQIDYAVALRETGQYHKAAELLESINIDKFPGMTPNFKYIYYHNLADILYLLNRREEARIWYKKSLQIYDDIPNVKAKQPIIYTHDMMAIEVLHYEGEYAEALQKVARINCPTPRNLLDAALLAAKCHLALEEPEKAREKLQYVIDKGNRLYIVEEAKALLETIA
jgi:tetratricopeptide (TPR) repeat protein